VKVAKLKIFLYLLEIMLRFGTFWRFGRIWGGFVVWMWNLYVFNHCGELLNSLCTSLLH